MDDIEKFLPSDLIPGPDRDLAMVDPYLSAIENIRRGIRSTRPDMAVGSQAVRITKARNSIEFFAKTYLPNHFNLEFGEHLRDLCAAIEAGDTAEEIQQRERAGVRRDGKRIARVEPRDHGKSTLMLVAVPLWWLSFKLKNFIALFGSTDQAIGKHFSDLQEQLDLSINPDSLLLQDYPHLIPLKDFKGQLSGWTDSRIRLSTGATVVSRGLTGRVRGIKEGGRRPDAIILDDPQDEEDVLTHYRREKVFIRFRKTIMSLGDDQCDIIVEGNLLHKESLVSRLIRQKKVWDGKLYKAENLPWKEEDAEYVLGNTKSDGSPLWPERWPMERLRKRKLEIGREYAIEFLNEDRGDEDRIYNTGAFMRFDRRQLNLKGFRITGFWDPATGNTESRNPDFAAISVVATRMLTGDQYGTWLKAINIKVDMERVRLYNESPQRFYWVLDCFLRRCPTKIQTDAAIDFFEQYPIEKMYFEDNGAWSILLPQIESRSNERGVKTRIIGFPQTHNKTQRIMQAESVIHDRTFFAKQISPLVLAQFGDFPLGHDDAPDSIIGTIEKFEKLGRKVIGFV